MVGPPTMAGSKWQSRPLVVSGLQASGLIAWQADNQPAPEL